MAGDWIPMRLDLCDDPAVLEMADILDQPEEYVVGCLHKVWSWASRNCHDGTVTGVTKMSLSRAVKLPEAVSAMVAVGWLVEGKGADGRPFVSFPKWENWLSKSAKARLQNSMNQRNARQLKALEDQTPEPKRIGVVTNLSLSDRDKTVTTVQNSTVQENVQEIPPLSPLGETADPPKVDPPKPPKTPRKPKETVGEFLVPPRLDSPEVREALEAFERMRVDIGHRIKDRSRLCLGWDKAYRDKTHLLDCIQFATANEYQGIKPRYIEPERSPATGRPMKRESDLPKLDSNWEPA
jgi:hypothetical protein